MVQMFDPWRKPHQERAGLWSKASGPWKGPRIGKKAAAPLLSCQPEGRLGQPLSVQVKADQGQRVCVGLDIFLRLLCSCFY